MKIKNSNIRYPTDSAIDNYILESVLPTFITNARYAQKPIPKTKDFYKCEEFIWNNPHRTSKKLYKYFHQSRDQGKATIDQMHQLQQQDRNNLEMNKIQAVLFLKSQDHLRMEKRKQQRAKLEQLTRGIKGSEQNILTTVKSIPVTTSKKEEERLKDYAQQVQKDIDVQRKIQELIRHCTLENRDNLQERLKKRRQDNLQLTEKSGIKLEKTIQWMPSKFRSLSYTKSK